MNRIVAADSTQLIGFGGAPSFKPPFTISMLSLCFMEEPKALQALIVAFTSVEFEGLSISD